MFSLFWTQKHGLHILWSYSVNVLCPSILPSKRTDMVVIDRNWLRYIIPAIFLSSAATLFALRGLKAQGKLGHDFGKLTIRDQPPTNTIQKIMALKEALTALENFLVTTNIALLKLRTVALSRHLRVSTSPFPCYNDGFDQEFDITLTIVIRP